MNCPLRLLTTHVIPTRISVSNTGICRRSPAGLPPLWIGHLTSLREFQRTRSPSAEAAILPPFRHKEVKYYVKMQPGRSLKLSPMDVGMCFQSLKSEKQDMPKWKVRNIHQFKSLVSSLESADSRRHNSKEFACWDASSFFYCID